MITWRRGLAGAVVGVGLVMAGVVVRTARRPAPAPAVPEAMVQLRGVAELPERLEPFLGGTISVRLVSMREVDPPRIVLASLSAAVPGASRTVSWVLDVPRARAREAEDALLVVAVEDRTGLRYFASALPRALERYQPRGAPAPVNALGIRLTAVPVT